MSRFWKTDQTVTLGLFHSIGPANAYTYTLSTVLLPGLSDWSAFLRQVFPTPLIHNWDNRTHGRHCLKFTPLIVRHSLVHICVYCWYILDSNSPNSIIGGFNPPPAAHPLLLPTHPFMCHLWYYSGCEKSFSKSGSFS